MFWTQAARSGGLASMLLFEEILCFELAPTPPVCLRADFLLSVGRSFHRHGTGGLAGARRDRGDLVDGEAGDRQYPSRCVPAVRNGFGRSLLGGLRNRVWEICVVAGWSPGITRGDLRRSDGAGLHAFSSQWHRANPGLLQLFSHYALRRWL